MELHSFQDNSESLILSIGGLMLRFDFHHRYIDLLHTQRFEHQRALESQPLLAVHPFDREDLLQCATKLLIEFTLKPEQLHHVYRHDRNDRFVLMEGSQGQRLELDKDLNGVKDRSSQNYLSMYKRKPDNYYRDSVIIEYLRINHDQRRVFQSCLKAIQLINQGEF